MFQAAVDYFNPRTRVGCDDEMQWGNRFCQYFNPRTRVGCDITSVLPPERVYHFNPRTRVGCDHDLSDSVVLLDISIHAPAWGATVNSRSKTSCIPISIHAPAWGATMKCNGGIDFVSISIHAPAWGATSPGIAAPPVVFYFNPRTRVGCDAPINMGRIFFCLFQSTHPRGVRLSSYSLKSFRRNFNPRTRVGCDYFRENCYYPALISIHAPAWGATGRHTAACAGIAISIHAPAWGATLFVALFHIKAQFQSTHPRGVRQSIL